MEFEMTDANNNLELNCPRDVRRLTMAAWGVGGSRADFRSSPREKQERLVMAWVDEALAFAEIRRAKKSVNEGQKNA